MKFFRRYGCPNKKSRRCCVLSAGIVRWQETNSRSYRESVSSFVGVFARRSPARYTQQRCSQTALDLQGGNIASLTRQTGLRNECSRCREKVKSKYSQIHKGYTFLHETITSMVINHSSCAL